MKRAIINSILTGCLVLCSLGAGAQNAIFAPYKPAKLVADTIFVYDTVFVTDTLRIYLPTKNMTVIHQLPTQDASSGLVIRNAGKENILIISSGMAATISTNSITDSVNIFNVEKSEAVKKLSFFGVVFFAFQNMVLAQNDFHLNFGGGMYNLTTNNSLQTPKSPQFLAGLGYSRTMAAGKISLQAELNYHFLIRSDFDNVGNLMYQPNPLRNNEGFAQNYHLVNLPVSLQWNTKWFSPHAGLELYYKTSPKIPYVATTTSGESVSQPYYIAYHAIGWFIGFQVPISNRLRGNLNYFQGISTEYTAQFNGDQYSTKMRRLEVSLSYRLR